MKTTPRSSRFALVFLAASFFFGSSDVRGNIIEEQLAEIGAVPDEEIVVVQRKYTRKDSRWELTPVTLGGVPFGTVRRTLFGGASVTYHLTDSFSIEVPNFLFTKTFFSGFTSDINAGQGGLPSINVNEQRLLFFLTAGIQYSPFYGKLSTFSDYIAYIEPFFTIGGGMAKTETNAYLTLYPGIGFRIFFKEWFSMRFDFRDYIYLERAVNIISGLTESNLRNNYAFTISLSFWLPKMPSD